MKKNHFSKVMMQKSDLELKNITMESSIYTEDAIKAAIWEIENRSQNIEISTTSEKQVLEIENDENLRSRIEETEIDNVELITDDPSLPEMYTKETIFFMSVIFSTFFGSILLSSNLKETKNSSQWIVVVFVGFTFSALLLILVLIFGVNLFIIIGLNVFGSKVLTEHLWNKYIGKGFRF